MSENRSGEWSKADTRQSNEQLNTPTQIMSRTKKHARSNEGSWFGRKPKVVKEVEVDHSATTVVTPTKEERIEQWEEEPKGSSLPIWVRSIFWLLRKSIAPIIMIIMLMAGLYIGYVVMGGQSSEDVFEFSTYKHMWDLIFAES